jgi:hypothetical protein
MASSSLLPRNFHCKPAGRSCMTHHQVLQNFPYMSKELLHKNNKINLPIRGAHNDVHVNAHTVYII